MENHLEFTPNNTVQAETSDGSDQHVYYYVRKPQQKPASFTFFYNSLPFVYKETWCDAVVLLTIAVPMCICLRNLHAGVYLLTLMCANVLDTVNTLRHVHQCLLEIKVNRQLMNITVITAFCMDVLPPVLSIACKR